MEDVSDKENSNLPFSRRFTLKEIWEYLSRKYSDENDEEEGAVPAEKE